ncbi:N-acetyltransferase family protein [Halostagnicola bangensis]
MPQVRPVTLEDVSAIRRIARNSWHATYDEILGSEAIEALIDKWYTESALEESIQRTARRETDVFLIGTLEKTAPSGVETVVEPSEDDRSMSAVGFAQATPADNGDDTTRHAETTAELNRIYVDPDAWDNSVGSTLLEGVERELEESFERLRLNVLAGNTVGISFYESIGFERLETKASGLGEIIDDRGSIDDPVEEHVYEKPL